MEFVGKDPIMDYNIANIQIIAEQLRYAKGL